MRLFTGFTLTAQRACMAHCGVRVDTGPDYCQDDLFIRGTALPCAAIAISVAGQALAVCADERGRWSAQLAPLAPGSYALALTQRSCDAKCTSIETIRVRARNSVSIDAPNLTVPLAEITGEATPFAVVRVVITVGDMVRTATTQADAQGRWSVPVAPSLQNEEVTINAVATLPPCPPAAERIAIVLPPLDFFLGIDSLAMGEAFRTVDAVFRYGASETLAGQGVVYYLLLAPGEPAPDAQTIIDYNDQQALADGTAARGRFALSFGQEQIISRALPGREVPAPYPDETGVVDGYRYVLYAVAQLAGQVGSVAVSPGSALGMPFEGGAGTEGSPFGLRQIAVVEMTRWPDLLPGHPINRAGVAETARMLDNIEGMAVLLDDTDALYGLPGTLKDAYHLLTSFDLAGYAAAYGGAGWRPIGNLNASLAGGPEHIFTGAMDTDGPRRIIANMPIAQTPENTGVVAYAGLFGAVRRAAIAGFDLAGAKVSAQISEGHNGHVGALAGALTGSFSPMGIDNCAISAQALGSELLDVGGAVGTLQGPLNIHDMTLTALTLAAQGGDAAVGGLAGRLFTSAGATQLSDIAVTGQSFISSGACGGLLGALVALDESAESVQRCIATVAVSGGAFVGGLIGLVGGNPDRDPSLCDISGCVASGDISGFQYVGGLIGNAEHATIAQCAVPSGSISDTSAATSLARPFGGLVGGLHEGSIMNSSAAVDVLVPFSSRAGGLIGDLTVASAAFSHAITNCSATGRVSAVSFVGGLVGSLSTAANAIAFTSCFATGSAVGSTASGGTSIGGLIGSALSALCQSCYATGSASGRSNVGGLIGDATSSQCTACYARGNVNGSGTSVAGFIGAAFDTAFERCFATGSVTATGSSAGAFVSNFTSASSALNCYASGNCQSAGNTAGMAQAISQGSSLIRCYASGTMIAALAAGGVVAAGSGGVPNPVSACFALNPLVAAGGSSVVGRVAASAFALALSNNSAVNTLSLTRGGVPVTPTPGANLKDGATVTQGNLAAAMQAAGWSGVIWDFSTIPTLGRPLLIDPREE